VTAYAGAEMDVAGAGQRHLWMHARHPGQRREIVGVPRIVPADARMHRRNARRLLVALCVGIGPDVAGFMLGGYAGEALGGEIRRVGRAPELTIGDHSKSQLLLQSDKGTDRLVFGGAQLDLRQTASRVLGARLE